MEKYKLNYVLGIIFLLILIVVSGCQKTPEKPIVVNKADKAFEQIIEQQPDAAEETEKNTDINADTFFKVSEHYVDEIIEDYVELYIDADVLVPDVKQIPVSRVTPALANEEITKRFIDYFVKNGAEVKNGIEGELKPATKSELEAVLIKIKKSIIELQNGKELDPDEEVTVEERIADLEQRAIEYQELIKNYEEQPDHSQSEKIDYQLKTDYFGDGNEEEEAYYVIETEEGDVGQLRIANIPNEVVPHSTVSYERNQGMALTGKIISEKAAREIAEAFLEEIDLGKFEFQHAQEYPEFICLTYSRALFGIPLTYTFSVGGSGVVDDSMTYSFVLQQEYIEFYIDDAGIAYFHWDTPLEFVETENANVKMKTFDEIKEIGKKNLLYGIDPFPLYKHIITIKEIKLGYMAIPLQNDLSEYRIIPVWDFIGEDQSNYSGSYLTLNAIDGSIIDRNLGY